MISSKKLTVFSVLSLITSMILYCVILGWEIDTMEFEDLHIVLSLAQMFLALSLFFVVSFILLKKGINAKILKKFVISFCCLAIGVTVAFVCYNGVTRYDWYMPENVAEEKRENVLSKQILRSGTSIGANIRESKNAQSDIDFIHKLSIPPSILYKFLYPSFLKI